MAKTVTMIPPTRNLFTATPINANVKRRVAGYARVSTDSDEQFTSYEAQVDYYTNYIQSHADWVFVKVYTDEGISGVNTLHRDGFNEMIADAMAGKIDLIVTKSVSRFARNTVDSLVTIRKLKDHGCECFFEKENIYTFDGKGEVLLTIMSSLAQEESRSISENVTWGQRKRFADGKVSMAYSQFLGYKKGENGLPAIVPEEANVVRLIYRLFLDGKTTTAIKHELESHGVLSPVGKTKWYAKTIESILKNEKYKGDALLQKSFTVDFLTKKMKPNEGEVPQYYVKGSHPAIISPEEYDAVQVEFERRKKQGRAYSGANSLSSRIICEDCGSPYGMKVWHSNDPYRRTILRCNRKFDQADKCLTPTLTEEMVHTAFFIAYNDLMGDRKRLIEDCTEIQQVLTDTSVIDTQIECLTDEIDIVAGIVKEQIYDNASKAQNQEEYEKKRAPLIQRYEKLREKIDKLHMERTHKIAQHNELNRFISELEHAPYVLQFWDDTLWLQLIDTVTAKRDGALVFHFKIGKKVTVPATSYKKTMA